MERLTVSEVALRLGISEDAVRKLDIEEDAGKGTASEEHRNAEQNSGRSWWDYAAGASGLVVVLGLMIYVLGLLALWAPIMRTYTNDAVTAWHAVSLVPRPVVAGLGVRQLVAFPLLTTLTLLALTLVIYYMLRALRNRYGESSSPEAIEAATHAALETILPVYSLVLLYAAWLIKGNLAPLPGVSQWRLALSILFLMIIASILVFYPFSTVRLVRRMRARENADESHERLKYRRRSLTIMLLIGTLIWMAILLTLFYVILQSIMEPKLLLQQLRSASADHIIDTVLVLAAALLVILLAPIGAIRFILLWGGNPQDEDKSERRRGYLIGLAFTLGSTFLAAFMLTFVSTPPLATANVDGSTSVQGHLLTHVDGYWYVFDRNGNIVATHDDKVTEVEICSTTTGKVASTCTQGE